MALRPIKYSLIVILFFIKIFFSMSPLQSTHLLLIVQNPCVYNSSNLEFLSTAQQIPPLEPTTFVFPPEPLPHLQPVPPSLLRHQPNAVLKDPMLLLPLCTVILPTKSHLPNNCCLPQKGAQHSLCNFLSCHCYSPQYCSFIPTVVRILALLAMPQQFLIPTGKQQCNLNWSP